MTCFFYVDFCAHVPENAKRGGETSRGDPPRKTVSDPPHLSTFPPLPCHFSYEAPYKLPEFPSGDLLKNTFRRVSKNGSKGPSLRGFPPLFCLPPLARPRCTCKFDADSLEGFVARVIECFRGRHKRGGQFYFIFAVLRTLFSCSEILVS